MFLPPGADDPSYARPSSAHEAASVFLYRERERPLHAVLRAHPPATSTDCPAVSDGGRGAAISRPFVRGPIGHCDSPVVLPP